MPTSVQESLSGGHQSAGGGDVSTVGYPPPNDVSTYIRAFSEYFDCQKFSMPPMSSSALTAPFATENCDTVVGAWRKSWKHWGRREASTVRVACSVMESPFVRCSHEDGYQQRLAALLAEVCRWSSVTTFLDTDLL